MRDFMALITLNEHENKIKELTHHRPIASIPIGGRYRVIDFVLSNLVNASITNVGIFAQNKYHSLQDHIRSGKDWDLDRKRDGLYLFTPMFNYYTLGSYNGDIEHFNNHINYIYMSKQDYVLIAPSYFIYNIDLEKALTFFKESNTDMTILAKKVTGGTEDFLGCKAIDLNDQGLVKDFRDINGKNDSEDIFIETYLMKKSLFLDLIHTSASLGDCKYIFDAVKKLLNELKINVYYFNGFLACIHSTRNYYNVNMKLIDTDISSNLFFKNGLVYTKVKNEPPTKYSDYSNIDDSLIANGGIIDGSIENSVIFRTVRIEQNASVKNSVVMQNAIVEEGAYLNHVILDKNVRITKYKKIEGTLNKPVVIEKNRVI